MSRPAEGGGFRRPDSRAACVSIRRRADAGVTTRVRLYSSVCGQDVMVVKAIRKAKVDLKVMLGVQVVSSSFSQLRTHTARPPRTPAPTRATLLRPRPCSRASTKISCWVLSSVRLTAWLPLSRTGNEVRRRIDRNADTAVLAAEQQHGRSANGAGRQGPGRQGGVDRDSAQSPAVRCDIDRGTDSAAAMPTPATI